MGLFGWKKIKPIRDLTTEQLVLGATQLLRKSGRNQSSYRLVYHALVQNPYDVEALLRLAEFFDDGHAQHGKPNHQEVLAALILEYALDNDSPLSKEDRQKTQKYRLQLVWAWGYAKLTVPPAIGVPPKRIEQDPSAFTIDEQAFLNAISHAAGPYGFYTNAYTNAFVAAHTLVGVKGGLVVPLNPNATLQPWEVTRSKFAPSPDYEQWLNSDSDYLSRLGINLNISV